MNSPNKRVIVNVATGDFYCKMQERLYKSFCYGPKKLVNDVLIKYPNLEDFVTMKGGKWIGTVSEENYVPDSSVDMILWHDCLPLGSRSHSESPYGFKVHAIKAAYEMGYTSILWVDSPAYAVKEDISPIFEKIEKEGYYAMSHIDPLERWVGVEAMDRFGVESRDELKGLNLPSGSCYGFYMNDNTGFGLLETLRKAEETGLFANERFLIGEEMSWHRHDEAILALALKNFDVPLFQFDPLFQSDSPECVIKSGGEIIP